MNFKGGVLIIGSLLWEPDTKDTKRNEWRTSCLNDISTKTPVKVKIRYGRESCKNRKCTYTMIFSNPPTTEFGQAYILGFKEIIKNVRILEKQAFTLASAEGIRSAKPPFESLLNASWGTVGLLVNPNVDNKDKAGAEIIRKQWTEMYQNYKATFNPDEYRIDNEAPVIDGNGFMNIEWTAEMNDCDF
ncbi:MAG: hypothetical protein ICV84_00460 [Flavisolibacter sp.]|nr:hypothetical protein [Flavisolibacter sp.]